MFLFSCSFFLLFQFFHSAGNDLFKIQLAGKLRLKPYGYVSKKKNFADLKLLRIFAKNFVARIFAIIKC